MNLLVDPSAYNCQNLGDLAMLVVATRRLQELWPSASIAVITNAPERITAQCGNVVPVPVRGRRLLLGHRLLGPFDGLVRGGLGWRWRRAEDRLRVRASPLFSCSLRLRQWLTGRDSADARSFVAALARADLVVVSGAGVLTDAFRENALGILATLDMAQRRGVPTALFGQGIGPLEDEELRRRASDVLRHVDLIAVRESAASPRLLLSLGVAPRRIVVTGDDALEMAYLSPGNTLDASPGRTDGLGLNVRIAPYAGIGPEWIAPLREAFSRACQTHGARPVPLPIARHGGRMDLETLRALLQAGDGPTDDIGALDTPQKVIARAAQCRVVVTGSYHAAVFALGQGIPAVGLAGSPYYRHKFDGLAGQFGAGCEVVTLNAGNATEALLAAIARAWACADRLRPVLLGSALDQIRRGRAAYARLRDLVERRGEVRVPAARENAHRVRRLERG